MADALKLKEAIKQLSASVHEVMLFFDKIDVNDLPTLIRAYKQLKDNNDELQDLASLLDKLQKDLSYNRIPETFENHGIDSMKIAGYNFILNVRTNASIPLDKREAGFKWLRDNNLGNLIQENVNAKSLSSAIKEHMEEIGKTPPEDAINIFDQRYISVRKS